MTADITVYLRGGEYPVDETIAFTAEDSATNGRRITYTAYQDETPVLEAGKQVSGWTQVSGNIWSAPLERADKLRALYVDGTRFEMASKWIYSDGCYGTYTVTAGQAPWAWESGEECDGSRYPLDRFPAIPRNQSDVEVMTQTTWTTAITGVRQVTTNPENSQRVVLFQQPGAAIAEGAFNGDLQSGGWQRISNAYEFLDEPNEFFFDREAQRVFVYKTDANPLTSVVAPDNVETVLSVTGTNTSTRATNLTFSGLTVRHSDWNLAQVAGSSFKQAQQGNLTNLAYTRKNFHDYVYRNVQVAPGAVEVNNAAGIEFVGNHVEHTGSDGIQFVNDVVDSRIDGNTTEDIAGSAINVGDPQHVYIGDGTATNGEHWAAGVEGAPKNISVRNNYLHDNAVLFWGSAAITGYFLDSVSIESNRIDRAPWAGISMGWGWGNFDGDRASNAPGNPTKVARNNSIQRNEILNVMRNLSDSGPLYTLGNQQGSTISENYARGVRPGHTYGLHPDEGSAFIKYNNNVMEIPASVAYVINSGTWGRQHDLEIRNTYGPINSIFDRNIPNTVLEDVKVVPDFVWPAPAYNVAVASGIQPEYRGILKGLAQNADFAMPASVLATDSDTAITLRGVGDPARKLWLAPAGTTSFTAGATMTSAAGDATTIALPQDKGDFKLFVVEADGTVSSTSTATVVRTGPAPRNQTLKLIDAQKCLDLPGSSTSNGTQPALWNCKGDPNQIFSLTSKSELSVLGKCLTPANGGKTAGTRVILEDCTGSADQKWSLGDNGSIVGTDSGLCLVTENGRLDNGGPSALATCTGASNQRWEFPIADYTRPSNAAPAFTEVSPVATASVGDDYTYTFAASGYPAPIFAVAEGQLPKGLTLSEQGVLAGTLTEAGVSSFKVRASNGVDPSAVSETITISVSGALVPNPNPNPEASTSAGTAPAGSSSSLASTGFELFGPLAAAGMLLLAGGAFLARRHIRRTR